MRSIVRKLDQEWASLARSHVAARAVRDWAALHPIFGGLPDLAAVLELRLSAEYAQDVLSALAAMAPSDELAARTLLQALIPGLVAIARIEGHRRGVLDELISHAWIDIRAHHPGRVGSVAGNILMAVRSRYRRDCRRLGEQISGLSDAYRDRNAAPPAEEVALGNLGLGVLVQRLRRAHVADEMIEALVRTRVDEEAVSSVSADLGIAPQCLTMRLRRTEQRLSRLALAR